MEKEVKEKIIILKDDICLLEVDAIVCHANTELEMCEEISEKLLDHGGDNIQNECNGFEKLSKGQAVITQGGDLPAKFLIHAIVEHFGEEEKEGEEETLMKAIRESLYIVKEKKFETIALPLIGTADYNIPIKRAAELIMAEIKKHLDGETSLETVYFVAQNANIYEAMDEAYKQL